MRKISILMVALLVLTACKETKKEVDESTSEIEVQNMEPISDAVLETAVIYEANIRQYSPEGTFNVFTEDIPSLKNLGVKIIWLMPIHPISEVKRKAKGDLSIEEIEDPEERKKYLGSYYSVANYNAVNPDFGTKDDFRKLVQTAHANGMYVILDWVPNHTGWDHQWITDHPEYYTKNEAGEITDPLNDEGEPWGWTDVADLDYNNLEMQQEMISEMSYWISEEGVDGFRCDVAHGVPVSFWEKAIPELRKVKPIFMLAEAQMPALTKGDMFEMSYGWKGHHILNAIAQGKQNVADFDSYINEIPQEWESNDILMNFVTNHDENSWAGPVAERMGDAAPALTALTYCMPGMPLIYSGQEYDLDFRLKFFEKDSIPKTRGTMWPLLEQLGTLKNEHPALNGGKTPASYERVETSNEYILAFKRIQDDNELIYIANLSGTSAQFTIPLTGAFTNYMTDLPVTFQEGFQQEYAPWEYVILIK